MLTEVLGRFADAALVLVQKISEANIKFCSSADSLKAEL